MARILVVDDSRYQRQLVRACLEDQGHDTYEAKNGKDALELLEKDRPELMVCDLLMPELDGFGVLEALRERGDKLPVIILSANVQKASLERCQDLGARYFVNKPVEPDKIKIALDEVLSGGR